MIYIIHILLITQGICFSQQTDSLKTDEPLVISISNNSRPFTFINAEGKPAGLFVDIWKLWSQKTGQNIEFLPSTFNETLKNIENGSADIHSGLSITDERNEWMIFSDDFYEKSFYIAYPAKQGTILTIDDFSGHKVGIVENSSHEEYLRKNYSDIELAAFKSIEEALLSAVDGNIRAVIDSYLSIYSDITRLGLSGKFDFSNQVVYTKKVRPGVLKKNVELLTIIDNGFQTISDKELVEIEERWIPDPEKQYYRNGGRLHLSSSEKEWIERHNVVRFGVGMNLPPLQFV
ncbi:MAG: transporter substrate-binding domain-containing protein, partial [Desulfamplus sp.]|nr:transporter substrate-binding domain-containing protein [Desulfamplus sp.]